MITATATTAANNHAAAMSRARVAIVVKKPCATFSNRSNVVFLFASSIPF